MKLSFDQAPPPYEQAGPLWLHTGLAIVCHIRQYNQHECLNNVLNTRCDYNQIAPTRVSKSTSYSCSTVCVGSATTPMLNISTGTCFSTNQLYKTRPNLSRDNMTRSLNHKTNKLEHKQSCAFSAQLSKLTFDLHFCIMTSVWDFRNPPFYWMIL